MALRLPVAGPVDLLLVTGVRDGGPDAGAEGARRAPRRPTLHRRARLPRPGNADEQHRRRAGRLVQRGRRVARRARCRRPNASATALAARALGLGDDHLLGLPGADRDDGDHLATAVTRTLWPATWGYWLTQFVGLGMAGLTRRPRLGARPRRPLRASRRPAADPSRRPPAVRPAARHGAHPVPGRRPRDPAGAIVAGLIATGWRPALGKAARVGRGDPAADLVDVLRLDARSNGVTLRRALGPTFAANALDFLARGVPAEAWRALAPARSRSRGRRAADDDRRRAAALRTHRLAGRPAARRRRSCDRPARPARRRYRRRRRRADERPASLLAALVRQGWLREHADAAHA